MYEYFAPMEGVTGRLFRRVHSRYFPGVDKYFMPFVSPGKDRVFSRKDLRELTPEGEPGVPEVPQLLTCQAEDFLWAAEHITSAAEIPSLFWKRSRREPENFRSRLRS